MLVDKSKILSVANGRDPIYHSSFKETVQYVAYVKNVYKYDILIIYLYIESKFIIYWLFIFLINN